VKAGVAADTRGAVIIISIVAIKVPARMVIPLVILFIIQKFVKLLISITYRLVIDQRITFFDFY
jgi:hypothetical protein